ncbi:MAG: helix-turn-helix domain-containing protein [Candidatus Ornithomonoglobus sp.]
MSFGERLKNLREDKDEKQKDIAKILFVSPNMISAYEHGKHFPKNENALIALAKHFDVTTDYLLGYSDLPRNELAEKYADILAECQSLSDEDKKSVLKYIRFLKSEF